MRQSFRCCVIVSYCQTTRVTNTLCVLSRAHTAWDSWIGNFLLLAAEYNGVKRMKGSSCNKCHLQVRLTVKSVPVPNQ